MKFVSRVLIFFVLSSYFCLINGTENIDELKTKISNSTIQERIHLLNRLSELYVQKDDYVNTQLYAEKALQYAEIYNQQIAKVKALAHLAYVFRKKMQINKAFEFANSSLQIARKIGDKPSIIFALTYLADVTQYNPKLNNKLLEIYFELKKLCNEIDDKEYEAVVTSYIGTTFVLLKQNSQGIKYFRKALEYFSKVDNHEMTVKMYESIGDSLLFLGSFELAYKNFFKGIELSEQHNLYYNSGRIYISIAHAKNKEAKYLGAIKYYNKALDAFEIDGSKLFHVTIYSKIGEVYYSQENYIKAEQYLDKALDFGEKAYGSSFDNKHLLYLRIVELKLKKKDFLRAQTILNQTREMIIKRNDLVAEAKFYYLNGILNHSLDNYSNAFQYLKDCLKLSEKHKNYDLKLKCYKKLSEISEQRNDYANSLKYFKLFFNLNLKIFNNKTSEKITEIESKYQVEKKEKENALLKKNNEIQRLDIEKQKVVRNLVIVIFVLTLIIIGFLIRKYSFLLSFWKKKNFVGRYKLGEKIGSGGSGIVYMATDIHDKTKKVAIKILREESSTDNNYKKRFKSEGAIIDRFNHPNIVKVIERGEFGNTLFLAMEHLRGKSLDEIIKTESPLKITRIYKILLEITSAISVIHDKNIIHRDLKPENIIVCKNTEEFEQAKLLDFGIAKSKDLTSLTKTGSVLGTIHYLAPEQIQMGEITFKSDIYSLGIICYELLTGMKPFHAEEEEYILNKIINDDVLAPIELRSDIPHDLNELVLSMLMKDPKKRPTIEIILKYFREKSAGGKK